LAVLSVDFIRRICIWTGSSTIIGQFFMFWRICRQFSRQWIICVKCCPDCRLATTPSLPHPRQVCHGQLLNTAWFLRSGDVREIQGKSKYQGAKVNKDAEKSLNCFTQTAYNSSKFFSACFARRLFVSPLNILCEKFQMPLKNGI